MDITASRELADQLEIAIAHAIKAHSHYPNAPRDAVRLWDSYTPYVIHPIWCAMTLLTETRLPQDIRIAGAFALLWHDILEDTHLSLPENTTDRVTQLVKEMTFSGFDEEMVVLWERSDTTKLLKLYDKVSQFLDGTWLSDRRWAQLLAHTQKLQAFVEQTYGELNIVRIARAVCLPRT
jgi:hypothetical protein